MDNPSSAWTAGQKIAFRFAFLFFMLGPGIETLGFLPLLDEALPWAQTQIAQFAAKNILGIQTELKAAPTGSGDRLFDWVYLFCVLSLSMLGTAFWSWLDRRRTGHGRLLEWSRVYFRYLLAFSMFTYGFAKVLHSQMPPPSLNTLMKPYGNASPMNLLWTFVGFSKHYSAYTGWAEVLGGALLLFRRTALLGALVTAVVMFNVFVLNLCFDVPVKIYSLSLTLLALFIAAPDLRRVWDLFIGHRAIAAKPPRSLFKNRKWNIATTVAKIMLLLLMAGYTFWIGRETGIARDPRPPLYGIYDVKTFEKNGQLQAPLLTDTAYWRKLIITWPGFANVRMANDTTRGYIFEVDTSLRKIALHPRLDTAAKGTFFYAQPSPALLQLSGVLGKDSLRIGLERFDERKFLLTSRGFHWVSEIPFNR